MVNLLNKQLLAKLKGMQLTTPSAWRITPVKGAYAPAPPQKHLPAGRPLPHALPNRCLVSRSFLEPLTLQTQGASS